MTKYQVKTTKPNGKLRKLTAATTSYSEAEGTRHEFEEKFPDDTVTILFLEYGKVTNEV